MLSPKLQEICLKIVFSFWSLNTLAIPTPAWASSPPSAIGSNTSMQDDLALLREETVSIAIAHEQPISEAPSNVYVITEDDIHLSGATDIPTILRKIPGMEVIQMTGAHLDVGVRGDNQPTANKLLVLVDGRSIYRDDQGDVFGRVLPISLEEIKKIEVLKGPASVLYGFNAFDGVINIITKRPHEIPGLTLQVGAGEFGSLTSTAILGGTTNGLGYRFSLGRDQNNQWDNRDALSFRNHRFNGLLDYSWKESSTLTVSGGLANTNRHEGPNIEQTQVSVKPIHAYGHVQFSQDNLSLQGYWNRWDISFPLRANLNLQPFLQLFTSDGGEKFKGLMDSFTVQAQHRVPLADHHQFTYGIEYRHNNVRANFLKKSVKENRLGIYIQDEWQIFENLFGVGGLRFDMDTFINPTYSPRISLIYRPTRDHSIRVMSALAYRSPTTWESAAQTRSTFVVPLPFPPGPLTTNGALEGNNNLDPEQIISNEIGYQGWFFKHQLRLRFALFYNHLSELIGQSALQNRNQRSFINDGEADIYGGEAGVEFWATPWLSGFANYSYQTLKQSQTRRILPRAAPRVKINGGLRADMDSGLNGEVSMHYVGSVQYPIDNLFQTVAGPPFNGAQAPETRIGSYFLLNFKAGYRFFELNGQKQAEIGISVFNALNDKHQEHPLGETIKSRVIGWLTIQIL